MCTNSLSCRFTASRHSRLAALDDFIQHAHNTAGFLSQLDPLGLDRDGKQPDGITVFDFAGSRSLIWYASCCDTWHQTGIILSAVQPGSCSKKWQNTLTDRFQLFVLGISGMLDPSSMKFLEYVSSKITHIVLCLFNITCKYTNDKHVIG